MLCGKEEYQTMQGKICLIQTDKNQDSAYQVWIEGQSIVILLQ